ncbi:helix-turn-helix domain-containing protein [Streptomyces sp. NBC_01546]|uniref:XRE family transcriptional regulator n=1 Tax=Streptomyces sp. NBC_01546 TaxID=2975872 RepID=UPI0038692425
MADQLGTLLRTLRKQAGLTQEQVAERSKLGVRTIRRLETGTSTDHRLGTVNQIADALGAGPEERLRLAAALAKTSPEPVSEPEPEPVSASASGAASPSRRIPGALARAAEELANEITRRWQIEEEQRRVHDPFPLPVRWQDAPEVLTDRPENVRRLPPGATAGPIDLNGDLHSVADVYRRIPSGRLVVLGRAGSGKSILTIRFVLDLLATPAPAAAEAGHPIPVIFSLGSWDPTTTALHDWLIGLLLRDHPHLVERVPGGSTLAAALVDANLVLPVLDGFDEIAEGLRPDALEALNSTSIPLVLTSRREEFDKVVRKAGTPLVWAAGVELVDLTPGDLTDYLPRTSRPVNSRGSSRRSGREERYANVWDVVLEALRTQDTPAGRNLARVLSTPLMVILARTIYSEASDIDPADLLDTTRFPTEHSLEEHLLASFVPTVYRRRAPVRSTGGHPRRQPDRDPEQVHRWLGYLAHHLARLNDLDRQDLAWWRIGDSLRPSTRVIAVALTCTLSITVAEWCVGLFVHYLGGGIAAAFGKVLVDGALMGPIAGLAFGCVYGLMQRFGTTAFKPARVQLRLRLRLPATDIRTHVGRGPMRTFTSRFVAGLLGGFVMGAGCACATTLERVLYNQIPLTSGTLIEGTLINVLGYGLIFGSAAGLAYGLLAVLEAPLDIASAATPAGLLSANRATVSRQVLVLVPAVTLAIALGGLLFVALMQNIVGPLSWKLLDGFFIGAVGGLGGAFSYALAFTAWGQWVILTRVWLPLTGKLPWDTVAFLDDAYRRGVLRRTGAVYQFRHSRLQHHLGDSFRRLHTDHEPATFRSRARTGARTGSS